MTNIVQRVAWCSLFRKNYRYYSHVDSRLTKSPRTIFQSLIGSGGFLLWPFNLATRFAAPVHGLQDIVALAWSAVSERVEVKGHKYAKCFIRALVNSLKKYTHKKLCEMSDNCHSLLWLCCSPIEQADSQWLHEAELVHSEGSVQNPAVTATRGQQSHHCLSHCTTLQHQQWAIPLYNVMIPR